MGARVCVSGIKRQIIIRFPFLFLSPFYFFGVLAMGLPVTKNEAYIFSSYGYSILVVSLPFLLHQYGSHC